MPQGREIRRSGRPCSRWICPRPLRKTQEGTETEDAKGIHRGFLLAGKYVLVTSLEKLFPGKLYKKMYFIITSAILPILVKSFFARAGVRPLGIDTHCVDVTIGWIFFGTLIYV